MKTSEWLQRMNLQRYDKVFKKFNFIYVSDVRRLNKEGFEFTALKIKNRHHKRRILEMAENDKIAVKDFEFKTKQQTRQLLQRKLSDEDQISKILDKFNCAEKDVFTGFQLKDVLNKYDTHEEILFALDKIASESSDKHSETTRTDTDDEDEEEEEEKKCPTPSYSLKQLFTDLDLLDIFKTLKSEHDIDETNFWNIEHDKLMEQLKITKIGTK